MELKVIKNHVYGENLQSKEMIFKVENSKAVSIAREKGEEKVPVKRWFKVVGYKFVMKSYNVLSIKPQSITSEGLSFTMDSDFDIQPFGNFMIVKNSKKGDVYILGKGESITFRRNIQNGYEEYILSIKEN